MEDGKYMSKVRPAFIPKNEIFRDYREYGNESSLNINNILLECDFSNVIDDGDSVEFFKRY